MAIKAILFDLDHTLVDTKIEYKQYALNLALNYFNESATKSEAEYFWLNNDREKLVKEKKINVQDFWKKFHECDNPIIRGENTYAYPDALELLQNIKDKYLTGIITNAPIKAAIEEIKCLNYEFNVVLSANKIPKPNPHFIAKACEELNVNHFEAVYIGDDLSDMAAAKNCGMKGILIDRGLKDLGHYSPKINDLNEALGIFNQNQNAFK